MAFTAFLCKQYGNDETHYLIADRSIDCGSDSHKAYQVFALIMVLVYPIGVTTMYYVLLRRHKPALLNTDDETRDEDESIQHLAFLWKSYYAEYVCRASEASEPFEHRQGQPHGIFEHGNIIQSARENEVRSDEY